MNLSGPIISLIAANATANALLGGRVYPGVIKQSSTYPAAAINITGNTPANSKTAPSDMDRVLVQIDVYGSFSQAADADEAIRAAIDYQSTGDIERIFYLRTIDGYSDIPELSRKTSEYSIVIKR